MSEKYDVVAEAIRQFRKTHVQQNGETPEQTEDRVFGLEYPKFQQFGVSSEEVKKLLALVGENQIRADKVNAVKAEIASGTYEDEQKLSVAVDRLLDELIA